MPAATTNRVELNTGASVNSKFQRQLQTNITRYANASNAQIDQRLAALEREWSIERVVELEAPTMIGLGAILGATLRRGWFALSALAASMVILHNTQGWYPLLPLLRRLGLRSQNEIEQERSALRALRGDHRVYQSTSKY